MQLPTIVGSCNGRLKRKKSGQHGEVLANAKVNEFLASTKKRMIRKRQAADALFKTFVTVDLSLLKSHSNNKLAHEGTYPLRLGEKEVVPVYALKNPQLGLRIYGVICKVQGKDCFIATNYDTEKKQDKADQKKLSATALAFGDLYEPGN